jgi:hypothetical protein
MYKTYDERRADEVKKFVAHVRLVAGHVAKQPRGYATFEVAYANAVLNGVDIVALKKLLNSVLFVSTSGYYEPLTRKERRVEKAAMALDDAFSRVRARHAELAQLLTVA